MHFKKKVIVHKPIKTKLKTEVVIPLHVTFRVLSCDERYFSPLNKNMFIPWAECSL